MLNKKIKSPDKAFSYDPAQLKNLIHKIRKTETMLGCEKINKRNY